MSKGVFANEEVMEEYLNALLVEEVLSVPKAVGKNISKDAIRPFAPSPERVKPVEELLKQVEIPDERSYSPDTVVVEPEVEDVQEVVVEQVLTPPPPITIEKDIPVDDFQALYFEVAGLVLAVPLTELGGIHNLNDVSPLFGKPKWFKGLMIHREQKINVVDSAQWVMPEKYNDVLADSLDYKYLIMLGDSNWGLACEGLVNTVTMAPEDIKWRTSDSKRPWLAGLVKEKMCALLDVKQLIQLLEQGLNSLDKK